MRNVGKLVAETARKRSVVTFFCQVFFLILKSFSQDHLPKTCAGTLLGRNDGSEVNPPIEADEDNTLNVQHAVEEAMSKLRGLENVLVSFLFQQTL
jgi:hypothetical protein